MYKAIVFSFLLSVNVFANWEENSAIGLQAYGYAGEVNTFYSYQSDNQRWQQEVGIGVTKPTSSEEIYQLNYKFKRLSAWKKKYNFADVNFFYWGILFSYTGKKDFFIFSPSRYDEPTYYENVAFRWNPLMGMNFFYSKSKVEIFVELSFQDYFLVHMLNNPKTLRPIDAMSIGFGFKKYFWKN